MNRLFKVREPGEEQPTCYVMAENDGRAIIRAFLEEESEEFQERHALGKLVAEEVTDLPGPLSMRALVDAKRARPYCMNCAEGFLPEGSMFCCEECQQAWNGHDIGADPEDLICLYVDY